MWIYQNNVPEFEAEYEPYMVDERERAYESICPSESGTYEVVQDFSQTPLRRIYKHRVGHSWKHGRNIGLNMIFLITGILLGFFTGVIFGRYLAKIDDLTDDQPEKYDFDYLPLNLPNGKANTLKDDAISSTNNKNKKNLETKSEDLPTTPMTWINPQTTLYETDATTDELLKWNKISPTSTESVFTASSSATDQVTCYIVHITGFDTMNFESAVKYCGERRSSVATIPNLRIYNMLLQNIRSRKPTSDGATTVWINGTMNPLNGHLDWRDNPVYIKWGPREPNTGEAFREHTHLYIYANKDPSSAFSGMRNYSPKLNRDGVICQRSEEKEELCNDNDSLR